MRSDGIRLIRAPNPGPLTGPGTNTWLVGTDPVAVIDPGPLSDAHLGSILRATAGASVDAVLVTHAHLDHSSLAAPLAARTGAPVLAFGDARAGRSARMEALDELGGGEGVDASFAPDRALVDGETFEAGGTEITALHTPGHFGNHLCFEMSGATLSGDLVMGWATTLISPPDGDLADFRASCRRMLDRAPRRLLPGHGDPVSDPSARIQALLAHRDMREGQVRSALVEASGTPDELAALIYRDLDPGLLPAAARNVLAHLIDLADRGLARAPDGISATARFEPA